MGNQVSVKVGATGTAVAVLTDLVNPANPITGGVVTWSSSDSTVCTIDATTGNWTVIAVGAGSCQLTATATANGFTHGDNGSLLISAADNGDFSVAVTLSVNP